MSNYFSSIPPLGQLPRSLAPSQIHFNNPIRLHPLSKALHVRGYFHDFILLNLHENKPMPTQHMDWEFGICVDRPFHCIYPKKIAPIPKRRLPSGVKKIEQPVEETNFWELEPPDVDPYGHKDAEIIKPRFRICCELVLWYLRLLVIIVYGTLALLVLILWEVAKGATAWAITFGKWMKERETWQKVISVAIAVQFAKLLPGLASTAEVKAGTEPLYVIMIPSYKLMAASGLD